MAKKKFSFEMALSELEQTIEQLEAGELSLDASLLAFEKGILLTRECQQALRQAEQKISILVQKNGHDELTPFEEENNDS
jgi:exodeoxyribonuclease VII small subunit